MATRVRATIGGRRAKWAILAVWLGLLAIFAPLGLKLPELTNDEIVLPSTSADGARRTGWSPRASRAAPSSRCCSSTTARAG